MLRLMRYLRNNRGDSMLLLHAGEPTTIQEGDRCQFNRSSIQVYRQLQALSFSEDGITGSKDLPLPLSALFTPPEAEGVVRLICAMRNIGFEKDGRTSFTFREAHTPPWRLIDRGSRAKLEEDDHLFLEPWEWSFALIRAGALVPLWDGHKLHPQMNLPFGRSRSMQKEGAHAIAQLVGAVNRLQAQDISLISIPSTSYQFAFRSPPPRTPATGMRAVTRL